MKWSTFWQEAAVSFVDDMNGHELRPGLQCRTWKYDRIWCRTTVRYLDCYSATRTQVRKREVLSNFRFRTTVRVALHLQYVYRLFGATPASTGYPSISPTFSSSPSTPTSLDLLLSPSSQVTWLVCWKLCGGRGLLTLSLSEWSGVFCSLNFI